MLPSMPTQPDKIRENRLRAAAARQGFRLVKSSRRDPLASDYGRWMITDSATSAVVAGAGPSMTLDQVEHWLTHPDERPQ